MKKLLHLADIHYSKETQDLALASLECALEAGTREQIDAWCFAGDLFDRAIQNSQSAGFPRLVNVIQRMLDVAPILSVEGTVTHDAPGAYSVLCELKAAHPFYNLKPDRPEIVAGILFLGLPELTKEWILAGGDGISRDEADQKVIAEVRKILLGLGAIRAEHPELPCVFVAHAAIAGASMQNGQIAEGGITLGREDLALVGFDYGALGHFHLEQQIAGLPAYYPGPGFHTDWGHLGRCGCNLVTIDPTIIDAGPVSERATVRRIPFPHAPRKKIVVGPGEGLDLHELPGFQAWLVIRAPQGSKHDLAEWTTSMLLAGALPGSRVTVETIPTETVRAAEITGKRHLREKVAVYAEASDEAAPAESVLAKAAELEREAEEKGIAHEGAHVRINKVFVRGSIGIWKGQHVDEVTWDLDAYDPGLIALIGKNGAGKSTLFSFMVPFVTAPFRDGPIQNYFRLRDSRWELWLTDERMGAKYHILVQIDGANATGKAEYHLFRNDEPFTNGRREDYEEKVGAIFGSLALFLRSPFVSQRATKSNPDLSEATKGEKKAIFRELAGLDYLQAYAESAKAKAGAIEGEIELERARVNLIESQLTALPGIVAERKRKAEELEARTAMLATVEAKGRELKAKAEELASKVRAQDLLAQLIASLDDQVAQQKQIAALAEKEIVGYQAAMIHRARSEKVLADHAMLKEQEGKENGRLAAVNADVARIQGEYNDRLKAHHDAVRKIEGELARLRTEKARVEGDSKVLQAQIDHLERELAQPLKDTCPTCGQALPEEIRKTLHEKRAESEEKLCNSQQNHASLGETVAGLQGQIDSVVLPDAPPVPPLPPVDQAPLQRIRAALAGLDVEAARKSLALAQEAATRLEETGKQREKAKVEIDRLEGELEAARAGIDPLWAMEHGRILIQLEAARREYTEAQRVVATLEAQIESMRQRIEELEASERDLGERKVRTEEQACEAAEWRWLERACGADGIQALELDAMGPGIAEVANRLLSSAYGSRFAVEFRTTRIAGRGSKVKQVEDFSIYILDGEGGSEQELSTLSGGESVWIKRAISDAFGIIRDRSTGMRFLTVFQDEADGALDPEARRAYFDMLRAAHHESGRRHTVVITHSPEVQEMIGQKIDMGELVKQKAIN